MAEKTTLTKDGVTVEGKEIAKTTISIVPNYHEADLPVKLLHPDAVMPSYANEDDAGMDFYTCEDIKIEAGQTAAVPTGVSMLLPKFTELTMRPRSGISLNGCECLIHRFIYDPQKGEEGVYVKEKRYERVILGTVDRGYTGEIKIITHNTSEFPVIIPKGTKLAQGVVSPVIRVKPRQVEEFEEQTSRGANGFGSSDEPKKK